ncbi:MAG: hypothetical protein AAB466_02080 [Verrucomicrobiota bacterium]
MERLLLAFPGVCWENDAAPPELAGRTQATHVYDKIACSLLCLVRLGQARLALAVGPAHPGVNRG